jgi:hypothetical protein
LDRPEMPLFQKFKDQVDAATKAQAAARGNGNGNGNSSAPPNANSKP